jgi:heptosyltransferase-2
MQSQIFLTQPLARPEPATHRYERWRVAGKAMGVGLPSRSQIVSRISPTRKLVLVHSGARLPARVWPLARYCDLVRRLRENGYTVQVVCNPSQQSWWQHSGETTTASPGTVTELLSFIDQAGVFIGNDSGSGHLAAICGVPTFTIFGPQLPEWFVPLHPAAAWIEGKACPYKPCFDHCRFPTPHCIWNLDGGEVCARVEKFVAACLRDRL